MVGRSGNSGGLKKPAKKRDGDGATEPQSETWGESSCGWAGAMRVAMVSQENALQEARSQLDETKSEYA